MSSLYIRKVINGFSLFVCVSFFVCAGGGLFLRVYGPLLCPALYFCRVTAQLPPAPTWATVFPFVNVCLVQYSLLRWPGLVYYRRHCYWGFLLSIYCFYIVSLFFLFCTAALIWGLGLDGLDWGDCYGTVGMDLNVFFFFFFRRLRYVQPTTQESSVFFLLSFLLV